MLSRLYFIKVLLVSFILLPIFVCGQSINVSELNNIPVKTYSFKYPVRDFRFLDDTNLIVFSKRNSDLWTGATKGLVSMLNIETGKIHWEKKKRHLMASFYDNATIINEKDYSYHINNFTGKRKWYTDMRLLFWDEQQKIAYGMPVNSKTLYERQRFRGVNIDDGKTKWIRKLNMFSSLDKALYINDSVHIYSAKYLFMLNPLTGEGWEHKIKTFRIIDVPDVLGVNNEVYALNLFTMFFGVMVVPAGGGNYQPSKYQTNICSNIIFDDNVIYFAGSEQIAAISITGEIIWKKSLPKDIMTNSLLEIYNDKLYLVNTGILRYHQIWEKHGNSFIASFDKKTGKRLNMQMLGDRIITSILIKEKIILPSVLNVSVIDPNDLSILYDNEISNSNLSIPRIIDTLYRMNGNNQIETIASIPENIYMYMKNHVSCYMPELDSVYIFPKEEAFHLIHDSFEFKLLTNHLGTLIIENKEKKIIKRLSLSGIYYVRRNKLISVDDTMIHYIDLKQVFSQLGN